MKRTLMFACLLLAGALMLAEVSPVGAASAGTIDPTFNPGGKGIGERFAETWSVRAIVVQPDGKIIVGGYFISYNGDDAAPDHILRLNADGSRDTTFNPGGSGANESVVAIALQPDGKILIGGNFSSYNGDAAAPNRLMRLNADGTRDTGFNQAGTDDSGGVFGLALQPDGKILVGGHLTFDNGGTVTVERILRLNSDGSHDTSFNPGTGPNADVSGLALQPDGKVLVVGNFTAYNGDAAAPDYVLRINADGSRDITFNPGGSGAATTVVSVALQADGKILIGGYFAAYNGDAAVPDGILRLNADGTYDTSYNPGASGAAPVYAIALQPDGKILVGGDIVSYNGDAAAPRNVIRLNTNGVRDTTFNPGGAGANAGVFALALQSDGKVLAGGRLFGYNNNDTTVPAHLVRLLGQAVTQNQTITVNTHAPASAAFGASFTVAATSSSGLAVTYTSAGSCTNNGATFTMTSSTGTCTVKYDQPGTQDEYNAAPQVTETVTAQKANQSVAFGPLSDKTFGDAAFTVSATATSGLPVSFSATGNCTSGGTNGSTINITGAGSCTVTASQGGDANYNAAADVPRTFQIAKAGQTINFPALFDKTFGDAPFGVSATASSGLGVSFAATTGNCNVNGATVTITGAGSCTVTASQAGDSNYLTAAVVQRSFQIAKAATSVALGSSANPSLPGQSVTFTATVTSAAVTPVGSVQFKIDGANFGSAVSLNASGVAAVTTSALPAGSHSVTAEYGGNADFVASTATLSGGQTVGGVFEFAQAAFAVGERDGSLTVTVKRLGDATQAAAVEYATDDGSVPSVSVPCSSATGLALERCDYTRAQGLLQFAAGETEKTFTVLVNDDSYLEGTETTHVRLSNPTAGTALGAVASAAVNIADDTQQTSNPLADPQFFVRQHYHDFLNREPDADGLAFWADQLTNCSNPPPSDLTVCRVNVSGAFFQSIEFRETGYLVERMYKTAYGEATGNSSLGGPHQLNVPVVRLSEFLPDTQRLERGVVVGKGDWAERLDANKRDYALEFVRRARFTSLFPTTMTAQEFVARLDQNTGGVLTAAEKAALGATLGATPADAAKRAQVLRGAAESEALARAESNRAFVLMQYFGYLRRDPDAAPDTNYTGYDFWLQKLNEFNGNFVRAEMVKAFLSSDEYVKRFGQ